MVILSFKTKKDKEHLLDKAKKMEEYAAMIVDCIEESKDYDDDEYSERAYKMDSEYDERYNGRYGYRRRMR
jgi:coenzyme F420-reducing hydrogenase alpha subunit